MAVFFTKESAPLYDLLIKHHSGELPCKIPCIISNHEHLKEIAEQFNIPYHHFPISLETKSEQENAVREIIKKNYIGE